MMLCEYCCHPLEAIWEYQDGYEFNGKYMCHRCKKGFFLESINDEYFYWDEIDYEYEINEE